MTIYKSRWSISIPPVTLPTFLFTSPTAPLPDKPCFIDTERPSYALTYGDYRLWSQRLAAGLRRAGLKPGEAVMLYSGNALFFPVVLMGIVMAGGVFTGANPTYNAREVAYQFQNSGARWLFCAEGSLETGLEAMDVVGLERQRLLVFDQGYEVFEGRKVGGRLGCAHWTSFLVGEEEGRSFEWAAGENLVNETVALNYSSGTTGLPKGVEITHRNYISNTMQHMSLIERWKDYEKELPNYRWLCIMPMYHALAQTIFCAGAPSKRIPVYIMHKFDFEKMLQYTQNYQITDLRLVPPMVIAMSKSPLVKKYDLSSVRTVEAGAAPLGGEVAAEFAKIWPSGVVSLRQGYGMTEMTCSCLGWDARKISDPRGVGEPNANMEVRLVDPGTGRDAVEGDRGELWARGPNIMKGYWRNPKATQDTLTPDGWLKTGDIAMRDKHGTFFIVDRMKELIKVKGNQVAPAELEAQLLENEAIQDAAVVGVTINGEECPRAYCVKRSGQNINETEVLHFIESKVSKIKRLTGGVKFVDAISKNPSGKILRKLYREQAAKEVGDAAKAEARL